MFTSVGLMCLFGMAEVGANYPPTEIPAKVRAALDELRLGFVIAPPGDYGATYESSESPDCRTGAYALMRPRPSEMHRYRVAVSKRFNSSIAARTLVTRSFDEKTPTWSTGDPAFIVSPLLWYFDPAWSVHRMATWPATLGDMIQVTGLDSSSTGRRTIGQYILSPDATIDSWIFGIQVGFEH